MKNLISNQAGEILLAVAGLALALTAGMHMLVRAEYKAAAALIKQVEEAHKTIQQTTCEIPLIKQPATYWAVPDNSTEQYRIEL